MDDVTQIKATPEEMAAAYKLVEQDKARLAALAAKDATEAQAREQATAQALSNLVATPNWSETLATMNDILAQAPKLTDISYTVVMMERIAKQYADA